MLHLPGGPGRGRAVPLSQRQQRKLLPLPAGRRVQIGPPPVPGRIIVQMFCYNDGTIPPRRCRHENSPIRLCRPPLPGTGRRHAAGPAAPPGAARPPEGTGPRRNRPGPCGTAPAGHVALPVDAPQPSVKQLCAFVPAAVPGRRFHHLKTKRRSLYGKGPVETFVGTGV